MQHCKVPISVFGDDNRPRVDGPLKLEFTDGAAGSCRDKRSLKLLTHGFYNLMHNHDNKDLNFFPTFLLY